MRQEHYQKAEERNGTDGKAEEFTLPVCTVERKPRPPSQDHSALKESLDGKAGEEVCVVTQLPENTAIWEQEAGPFLFLPASIQPGRQS